MKKKITLRRRVFIVKESREKSAIVSLERRLETDRTY